MGMLPVINIPIDVQRLPDYRTLVRLTPVSVDLSPGVNDSYMRRLRRANSYQEAIEQEAIDLEYWFHHLRPLVDGPRRQRIEDIRRCWRISEQNLHDRLNVYRIDGNLTWPPYLVERRNGRFVNHFRPAPENWEAIRQEYIDASNRLEEMYMAMISYEVMEWIYSR